MNGTWNLFIISRIFTKLVLKSNVFLVKIQHNNIIGINPNKSRAVQCRQIDRSESLTDWVFPDEIFTGAAARQGCLSAWVISRRGVWWSTTTTITFYSWRPTGRLLYINICLLDYFTICKELEDLAYIYNWQLLYLQYTVYNTMKSPT